MVKTISDWKIWRCQRKILKRHARLYGVRVKMFESNDALLERILKKIKYRQEESTHDEQKPD